MKSALKILVCLPLLTAGLLWAQSPGSGGILTTLQDTDPVLRDTDPVGREIRPTVRPGLDVMLLEDLQRLRGREIVLFCNHSSRDLSGRFILDIIAGRPDISLKKAFIVTAFGWEDYWSDSLLLNIDSPAVEYLRDTKIRLRSSDFSSADLILFDMQTTGISSDPVLQLLKAVLNISRITGIPVLIPDRPLLIPDRGHWGPVHSRFYNLPFDHGLTLGELALYLNAGGLPGREDLLEIVPVEYPLGPAAYSDLHSLFVPLHPYFRSFREGRYFPFMPLGQTGTLQIYLHEELAVPVIWAEWMDAGFVRAALADEDIRFRDLSLVQVDEGRRRAADYAVLERPFSDETPAEGTEYTAAQRRTLLTETQMYSPVEGIAMTGVTGLSDPALFFTILRAAKSIYPARMLMDRRALKAVCGSEDLYHILQTGVPAGGILNYWSPEYRIFEDRLPEVQLYPR